MESTKGSLDDKTGVLCSYEFKIVHMDLELFNTVTYVIETTPGFDSTMGLNLAAPNHNEFAKG